MLMPERVLFDICERLTVPMDTIAHPSDINIFTGHQGGTSYYADFAGTARKYPPCGILEIGVRYGYSGIAMCLGARAGGIAIPQYTGIDAEFFSGPEAGDYAARRFSNTIAKEKFAEHAPWAITRFHTVDTQKSSLPRSVLDNMYGLVSIDGDHSFQGCLNDMTQTWRVLQSGGIMIIDDTGMEGVRHAIQAFIADKGDALDYQFYENERGIAILQKG